MSSTGPLGGGGVIIKIEPSLAKYINFYQVDWDVYLPLALSSYNNSYNSSIGMTPFEAHFYPPSRLKIHDIMLNNPLSKDTRVQDVSEYTLGIWQAAGAIKNRVK